MQNSQTQFKQTELGLIPEDWEILKLSDIADIKSGYAFKSNEFVSSGVPIIKIKNIIPPVVDLTEVEYADKMLSEKLGGYEVRYNDILISLTGSNFNQYQSAVGKIGRLRNRERIALLNQRVGKFEVKDKTRLCKDFLYYLLISDEVKFLLVSSAKGSGNQANISPDQIKSLEFAFPPIQEQLQIAKILGTLDEKIELNQKMIKTLESLGQVYFNNTFGEILTAGNTRLGDLIKVLSGFSFSSACFDDKGIYGLVTIKNVQDGNFSSICANRITNILAKVPDYAHLKVGDIILSLTGNVGRSCLVFGHDKYLLNQRVAKLSPVDTRNYGFTYFLFRNREFQNYLISISKGTAQQNLSPIETANIELNIPSSDALLSFGITANLLVKKVVFNMQEIEILSQIRDSLLPRLMSGKLRVK